MRDIISVLAIWLIVIVFCVGVSYPLLVWNGFLTGKQEEIRRDVTEQSKAYRDGMRKELSRLQLEYLKADPAGQAVIRSYIYNSYSAEPVDEYPAAQQTFLHQMGL